MKAAPVKLISLTLMITLLSACQTVSTKSTDPYTGEEKTSNTAKGGGIGAGIGAVLGALTAKDGKRTQGILKGALIGGAVGGGVGYYMDQQEAELRQQMAGTGVRIKREGDQIQLIMPSSITFKTASSDLAPDFLQALHGVALVLNKYEKTLLNIDGHTDSVGSASYNLQLSQQRANSVYNYLAQQGISPARMQTHGFGETRPIAANSTAAGRAENRRVELWIQPQQQPQQ